MISNRNWRIREYKVGSSTLLPLILLGKIDQLHLIKVLSPDFRIPRTVVEEIGAAPSDDQTIKCPSWQILLLPVFVLVAFLASLGPGLWLTALNVKYRDFRFVIPFIVQFGLYISPVGFSSSVVPEKWRLLYSLNPMVGVIDGFRWCILGGDAAFDPRSFAISMAVTAFFLWLGIRQFRKMEKSFADLI